MKKLLLLILCTTTLGLVSCKKDTIIYEPTSRTYYFNIQPNQWVLSGDGYTYTYEWNNPNVINDVTLENDAVLVYVSHPINSDSDIAIPSTFDGRAYSYELYDGGMRVDIQSSDLQADAPVKPSGVTRVKVVVIQSST